MYVGAAIFILLFVGTQGQLHSVIPTVRFKSAWYHKTTFNDSELTVVAFDMEVQHIPSHLYDADKLILHLWHHNCQSRNKSFFIGTFGKSDIKTAKRFNHMIDSSFGFTLYNLERSFFDDMCMTVQLTWGDRSVVAQDQPPQLSLSQSVFSDTIQLHYFRDNTSYHIRELKPFEPTPDNDHVSSLVFRLHTAIDKAQIFQSGIDDESKIRDGFSGRMFQHLLNNIGKDGDTRYLEIGTYNGSSLTAMLENNEDMTAIAIDSWDESYDFHHEGMKDAVHQALVKPIYESRLHILVSDCWEVQSTTIKMLFSGKGANIYFYDAGHSYEDHFMALSQFISATEKVFIYIVDDWNWRMVQRGTYDAIEALNLEVMFAAEVLTGGNSDYWHNGVGMFVIQRHWW